jgi:hypothetical protein
MNFQTDVLNKLTRLESKMVRGFEELGADTDADPNWLSVDDASRVIYVSTLGRSFKIMHSVAVAKGAKQFGKEYDIVHKGDVVGTVTL